MLHQIRKMIGKNCYGLVEFLIRAHAFFSCGKWWVKEDTGHNFSVKNTF